MTESSRSPDKWESLLEEATMRVADFANPNIKVVRRDEALAILRNALASAPSHEREIDVIGGTPHDRELVQQHFARSTTRLLTINNIERYELVPVVVNGGQNTMALEPDPDGLWVRFSDAAEISNRLASARSAIAPKDGLDAYNAKDAARYRFLHHVLRAEVRHAGATYRRWYWDTPAELIDVWFLDDAIDSAMKEWGNTFGPNNRPDGGKQT